MEFHTATNPDVNPASLAKYAMLRSNPLLPREIRTSKEDHTATNKGTETLALMKEVQ